MNNNIRWGIGIGIMLLGALITNLISQERTRSDVHYLTRAFEQFTTESKLDRQGLRDDLNNVIGVSSMALDRADRALRNDEELERRLRALEKK